MPVTFSSYRLGPGQRASYKTVPPPWDWLLRRENELGPRRSRSQIIFAVLVPPLYVVVQAPALIVTFQIHSLTLPWMQEYAVLCSISCCFQSAKIQWSPCRGDSRNNLAFSSVKAFECRWLRRRFSNSLCGACIE